MSKTKLWAPDRCPRAKEPKQTTINTHTEHRNEEVTNKDLRANAKSARMSVDIPAHQHNSVTQALIQTINNTQTHANRPNHSSLWPVVTANRDKIYRKLCKKKKKLTKPL
jgi:hypothetical protein